MIVRIDTSKWATPARYAEMKGQTVQVVFNWMKRGRVEVWEIPELNLKLVKIGSELKTGKGSS